MNSVGHANKFILFLFLYQIFVSLITSKIPDGNFNLIYSQLILLLIPIAFYFTLSHKKISDVLPMKKISKKNLCLLFLFAIAIQPVMSFISVMASMFWKNHTQDLIPVLFSKPIWAIFLSSAILPALFEEIIFRGIFFNGYKNVEWKKAFFINGLVFGAMHLNFQQFLYAMIMGIIFCILVYYTQSVYSSIIVHLIFNSTQLFIAYLMVNNLLPFKNFFNQFSNGILNCLIFAAIFLPVVILLLNCIIKNCEAADNKINSGEKILTLPLVLYLGFTFFIMCFN